MLNRLILSAAAALSFAALSQPALAATGTVPSNYTFNFVGQCTDCTGQGNATLTVQNYVLGTDLNSSNLVTFTYSSNLTSFTDNPTLDQGTGTSAVFVDTLDGNITSNSGFYRIHVDQTSGGIPTNSFDSYLNGTWDVTSMSPISDGDDPVSLLQAVPFDTGTAGVWNGDAVSAAPEPGTWALMFAGVALLGTALRFRRRATGHTAIA